MHGQNHIKFTFNQLSLRRPLVTKKKVGKRDKTGIFDSNKCYHALGHLAEKRYITLSFTVGLCKTVRTSVTSGVELRTLITKMERVFMTWVKKTSRKIHMPTYVNGN